MQIHELSRRRRADEGFMDIARGLGDAAGVTKGQAASAGILDPAKKLDAVRKNKDMQRVAAQLAAGWIAEAERDHREQIATHREQQALRNKPAQAPAAATPLPEAVGTYNKKTGAANLDGKTMTSLSDLPPAIQQQIQAKQQATTTPAATATTPAATIPATTPPKPGTPPGFNAANIMQMPGMQPAGKKPAPAPTTPTKPSAPPGFNAANVMKMPGMPGQPVTPGAAKPPAATSAASATQPWTPANTNVKPGGSAEAQAFKAQQAAAATKPAATATPGAAAPGDAGGAPTIQQQAKANVEADYLKKFLAYVNKKTAIRDASTYQMIGLDQVQQQSGLGPQLEAAKAKILQAYEAGNTAEEQKAATEYILIAMAGAQLISSKNRAGQELPPMKPDPNNPDAATGADGAAPGTAPTAGGKILDTTGVQAVFKDNGVDPAMLSKLGTALQRTSGTNAVTKTGNGTVDNMLRALGFKVT